MFFGETDGFFEIIKGTVPFYTIVFIPLFILISPMTPVLGAHEFTVYRMQHFDLHGTPHGCRSAAVNMEARTLGSQTYTRRCVIAWLRDLTHAHFEEIVQQGAGGLLALLPTNFSSLKPEEKQHIMELERSLLEEEVQIPVYFSLETPELTEIYRNVQKSSSGKQAGSAAEELWGTLSASGFQLVVSNSQTKAQSDIQVTNIQGKLSGFGIEEQLPTIVLVAHYDTYGIAPGLAYGADSNGSGVAALLELARLLSRLYTSSRTHPRFNLVFLLSGAGKFNFQGTKKWIEDNIDSSEGSLLPDALYTLCLESLGSQDELNLHVSKPPKEDSPGAIFFQELQRVGKMLYPELNISMVHKKINLAEELLSWEHERFSIRRLQAFTLSHFRSPKVLGRSSIMDRREKVDLEKLARNVRVIGEALAHYIYNLTSEEQQAEIITEGMSVQKEFLAAWLDHLTSQPRSAQLLSASSPSRSLVLTLEQAMARYLKEVKATTFHPDKRDPEFVFYEPMMTAMNAYSVKPAVFDIFLAIVISGYLCIVYLIVTNFHRIEGTMKQMSCQKFKQT
ncbi:BOS complex subunit ncln isoform X1 [Tachypleus tridentatus]|uniref:BOS complex subunit ncln isoform X1 n=1 Tax=Tachypleus tridentatus TaxID=6853 RepID=UPI003FD4205C